MKVKVKDHRHLHLHLHRHTKALHLVLSRASAKIPATTMLTTYMI
jgi:hypothetical protein